MVIWVIGLSGSGKTTLGRLICNLLKQEAPNTVLVDGDEIRGMFQHNNDNAYTIEERYKNAERICRLCAWLDRQGINVVCCILSLFEKSRQWNRQTYSKYFEVYIDVPMEVLKKRDIKGLYSRTSQGKAKNVAGVDISFAPPQKPDYVFDNSKDNADLEKIAFDILTKAKKSN